MTNLVNSYAISSGNSELTAIAAGEKTQSTASVDAVPGIKSFETLTDVNGTPAVCATLKLSLLNPTSRTSSCNAKSCATIPGRIALLPSGVMTICDAAAATLL